MRLSKLWAVLAVFAVGALIEGGAAVAGSVAGAATAPTPAVQAEVTPPTAPPTAPTTVTATRGKQAAVTVTWKAPATGTAVTTYTVTPHNVTAGTTGTPVTVTAPTTSVVFPNTALTMDVTYTFVVVANNAAGSSEPATGTLGEETEITATPTTVVATAGTTPGTASVTWVEPKEEETGESALAVPGASGGKGGGTGGPVAQFTVTPSDLTTGTSGTAQTVSGSTTKATFTGLTGGHQYNFTVVAFSHETVPSTPATSNTITVAKAVTPPTTAVTSSSQGYYTVAGDGGVFSFGAAQFHGSMGGKPLNAPMVGMAVLPDGKGYYTVASDGGVFSFTAQFHGSMGGKPLNAPVDGMTVAPTGKGYWLVARDGGVFTFGTIAFRGSMGGKPLNAPIVGISAAPTGKGYWEVGSDGGVFTFGTLPFYGSLGGTGVSNIVGIQANPGGGYELFSNTGSAYLFTASGKTSTFGGLHNVVDASLTVTGQGRWVYSSTGAVVNFGKATTHGSMVGTPLNAPVVGGATSISD